jgi:hypothetical protein
MNKDEVVPTVFLSFFQFPVQKTSLITSHRSVVRNIDPWIQFCGSSSSHSQPTLRWLWSQSWPRHCDYSCLETTPVHCLPPHWAISIRPGFLVQILCPLVRSLMKDVSFLMPFSLIDTRCWLFTRNWNEYNLSPKTWMDEAIWKLTAGTKMTLQLSSKKWGVRM